MAFTNDLSKQTEPQFSTEEMSNSRFDWPKEWVIFLKIHFP